jgi:hypothetical protein
MNDGVFLRSSARCRCIRGCSGSRCENRPRGTIFYHLILVTALEPDGDQGFNGRLDIVLAFANGVPVCQNIHTYIHVHMHACIHIACVTP